MDFFEIKFSEWLGYYSGYRIGLIVSSWILFWVELRLECLLCELEYLYYKFYWKLFSIYVY